MLNAVLRSTPYTSPSTVYAALFTSTPVAPTSTHPGTEVTGGSYSRQSVSWSAPSDVGVVYNLSDIDFSIATASWGTIYAWGIFDSLTLGNLLYYGALGAPRVVSVNSQVILPAGQLQISEL